MTKAAILIVEDERIIAKGIEKQLKSMGYAVAGLAATGEDAVRKAVELVPDLILMDISLGRGIDGVEAAGLIRGQMDVPIVYVTANSNDGTLERAKLTDPFGFILKPYEDKDLQTAIEIGLYRHKMERRLRENEQWLAATLGSIGDGVIATDDHGRVRYLNAVAAQLTGWQPDEAFGQNVEQVFAIVEGSTRQTVANPALEGLRTGEPTALAPNTLLLHKAGGERFIDDSAAPIRDVSGNVSGAVLVFRDITERRRLEQIKDQFLSHVSHELLSPLSAIKQFATIFADSLAGDLTAEQAHYHQIILKNVRQLRAMIDDLLDVTRVETGKLSVVPGQVSVSEAVIDALDTVTGRAQAKSVALTSDMPSNLPSASADPTRLRQILIILLDNAVKFTESGGAVAVRVHPVLQDPGFLQVDVSDNGSGISREGVDRIFDRLYQAEGTAAPGHKGLGLGLYICRELVQRQGGEIRVESSPQKGSVFSFTLPVFRDHHQPGGGFVTEIPDQPSRPSASV